jgi:hypothetical protein
LHAHKEGVTAKNKVGDNGRLKTQWINILVAETLSRNPTPEREQKSYKKVASCY